MKILHVNDVAHVGETLVEGLRQNGHAAELRRMRLVAGKHSTAIKLLASPLRLQELIAINHQIKSRGYDIVHIHFAYLGWLGITGRYPFYLHVHGSDVRRDLKDVLRRWFIVQSLKHAQEVFYVTPDLASILDRARPTARFLPDPVNIDRFRPIPVDEDHNARLLIISRLDPIKRVDIAFKAVEQALVKYPHLQITAIDSGPQRIRFLPQSGVTFIPPVAYADMPALIQAHDIIIGQFGLGCLGMAELESMACGKPVITYFSYPEWYESPPPILNSQNADQAYSALSSLLENPGLRRHLAGQSRAWVERHHNYITIARQLANYYAK